MWLNGFCSSVPYFSTMGRERLIGREKRLEERKGQIKMYKFSYIRAESLMIKTIDLLMPCLSMRAGETSHIELSSCFDQ